jgi:hypothetical protein
MDIEDLKAEIEAGRSIKEAAQFLCRADSVDDLVRKCEELGAEAEGSIMKGIDADGIAETEADHFMKMPRLRGMFPHAI